MYVSTFTPDPAAPVAAILCPLCRLPLETQEWEDGVCAGCADKPLPFAVTPYGRAARVAGGLGDELAQAERRARLLGDAARDF